jgi:hypothetical protein
MTSFPSSPPDPLQCTLRQMSDSKVFSCALVKEIWGDKTGDQEYLQHRQSYESYLQHIYQDLSKAACSGDFQISEFTHKQILSLLFDLKTQSCSKKQATQVFQQSTGCESVSQLERAVNLAAGLLVPLNFKSVGGARRGVVVAWEDDDNLGQTVAKTVAKVLEKEANASTTTQSNCTACHSKAHSKATRFPRNFSARQLSRIAGFEIIWTSNLMDHLRLQDDEDELKLYIFHQVKILDLHSALTK